MTSSVAHDPRHIVRRVVADGWRTVEAAGRSWSAADVAVVTGWFDASGRGSLPLVTVSDDVAAVEIEGLGGARGLWAGTVTVAAWTSASIEAGGSEIGPGAAKTLAWALAEEARRAILSASPPALGLQSLRIVGSRGLADASGRPTLHRRELVAEYRYWWTAATE